MKKIFTIQKIVLAESVEEACAIESQCPVTDVFIHSEFVKTALPEIAEDRRVGFQTPPVKT